MADGQAMTAPETITVMGWPKRSEWLGGRAMRPDNRSILLVLVLAALAEFGYHQHHAYAEWRNFVNVCTAASQGRSDADG